MISYRKNIEITDTGMVIASVYSSDGRRTGLKFFTGIFSSVVDKAKKAHAWADRHILICQNWEQMPENPR